MLAEGDKYILLLPAVVFEAGAEYLELGTLRVGGTNSGGGGCIWVCCLGR